MAFSTTIVTSTLWSNTPRPALTILIRNHGHQSWPRGRAVARVANGVVPQHLVVGLRSRKARLNHEAAEVTAIKLNQNYYGISWLYCEGRAELLFSENETNARRLYGLAKDRLRKGRHRRISDPRRQTGGQSGIGGTKAAAVPADAVAAGGRPERLRLSDGAAGKP